MEKSLWWKLKFLFNPRSKFLLEIPDLLSFSRYLLISPHPDDGDLFCGGLQLRLARDGKELLHLVVSDGSKGSYDVQTDPQDLAKIRKKEQEEASLHLGIKELLFWEMTDGELPDCPVVVKKLIALIREKQPECIICPDPWLPYEAHPDHVKVGMAGAEAAIFSSMPLYFPEIRPSWAVKAVAFYCSVQPNSYVDISLVWEKRMEAVKMHKSQFPQEIIPMLNAFCHFKSRENARWKKMNRAEAYKVLIPEHLHGNVDSWES